MPDLQIPNVLRSVCAHSWAAHPAWLADMVSVLNRRSLGIRLTAEEIEASIGETRREAIPVAGIQLLQVLGPLTQRMPMKVSGEGGTSTEAVAKGLDGALANPDVGGVLLEIDSPGGSVFGVQELAEKIRGARQSSGGAKPIWAIANSQAASAAYWIGSQADQLIVTPGGQVGSIGIFGVHMDESKALEMKGFTPTIISAGKYKNELHGLSPLSEDARNYQQAMADDYYDAFVNAVAKGRNVKALAVRGGFGEGRMVSAVKAVEEGMADAAWSMDETIRRMLKIVGRRGGGGGMAEREQRERLLKLRERTAV